MAGIELNGLRRKSDPFRDKSVDSKTELIQDEDKPKKKCTCCLCCFW